METNHATGPRTEEGKAKSSMNALKHGLTATTILLPTEDPEAYRLHCEALFQDISPVGAEEICLTQMACDQLWRLNRCPALEAKAIAEGDAKLLDIVSKHEARLKRIHSATMRDLQFVMEQRLNRESSEMKDAQVIRRADYIHKRTTDLTPLGFVLTIEKVDAQNRRESALTRSQKEINIWKAEKNGVDTSAWS
jgi:hypothetical protein